MEESKITVFILDDNIPKITEFVEQSLYDKKISSTSLSHLLASANWSGQHNLKQLTSYIIESAQFESGQIEVWGFTHPSLCLDAVEEGLVPNVVIYDWEYGSETNKESSSWLREILDSTEAFVFVYSMVRNEIPVFLNKSEFDKFSNHFQLFLKGDIKSSVFSSEEFILQYIVSTISKSNRIKLQGFDIVFEENGYLSRPSDILYLENILGRLALKKQIAAGIKSISNQSVEQLLENVNVEIYHDDEKNLLVTADSNLMVEKIKSSRTLTAVEVLKEYGILKLREVLEIGVAKT